jgi:hypothetical protein
MTPEPIRTLGFYQPFCSLMFHGKKETRWVRKGKKPPFPIGRYLLYSTKNKCEAPTLFQWCGPEIMLLITQTLEGDVTRFINGMALGFGELVNIRLMVKEDEADAFVKYVGEQERIDKNGVKHIYVQWVLEFKKTERIMPFCFKGKQGVGVFSQSEYEQLNKSKMSKKIQDYPEPEYGTKEWELWNSIAMQLQFMKHSGATFPETLQRIYNRVMEFIEDKTKQP